MPLFAHVWLDGVASAQVEALGHDQPFPAMRSPAGVPPDQIALPGEPIATLQLAVGLRVGLP